MAEATNPATPSEAGSAQSAATSLDAGNYEVLRSRLLTSADDLVRRVEQLNAQRQKVFGGSELQVTGALRLHTEQATVVADFLEVLGSLVVGFRFSGMKTDIVPKDEFGVWRLAQLEGTPALEPVSLADAAGGMLQHEPFARDLMDVHKYYRGCQLASLRRVENGVLAVYRYGAGERDVKVFRWNMERDQKVSYIDNRGDLEPLKRKQLDFQWTAVTREDHIDGRYPHASILGEVFVETIGGTLTIKVENNTETGRGIYDEPVNDALQTLDDAKIDYARLGGLIALRIRPYQEEHYRHFLYNTRTRTVVRADAIGRSCIQLPEGHGVIYPGGYCLQTGEARTFIESPGELAFESMVRSPNGEDILYVFHDPATPQYVLVSYNLIRKEAPPPIICHAWALFENGTMLVHRRENEEASRVHQLQLWKTPFTSAEFAASVPLESSFVGRIGNAELVRGISDCLTISRLITQATPSALIYGDLLGACRRVVDSYHWLGSPEVGDPRSVIASIQAGTDLIIGEFRKVEELRSIASKLLADAERKFEKIQDEIRIGGLTAIEHFMAGLSAFRTHRGHIITMRDTRYIDRAALDALEKRIVAAFDELSLTAVEYLQTDGALAPLSARIEAEMKTVSTVGRGVELDECQKRLAETSTGLDVLSEVVSSLQIDDPTVRATILERISEVYGNLNRVRATLLNRRKQVGATEKRAEFQAQFSLLSQAISGAVALADSPAKCDEQLSRVLLQIQELESRFAEFDEFQAQLHERREEAVEGFESRKQTLTEERQLRVRNLGNAATRAIDAARKRATSLKDIDAINTFFASDPMVLKLEALSQELVALGEQTAPDDIQARLQSARQDALRGARDAAELFEDGGNLIVFGKHRFSVNTQPLELALVPRDSQMFLHLTGTQFYERIDDAELEATRAFWDCALPSESAAVYRAEFLAARTLFAAESAADQGALAALYADAESPEQLLARVRAIAADALDEGYERGIHDADAVAILKTLLPMIQRAGALRFGATDRAAALLAWLATGDSFERDSLYRRARSVARLRATLGTAGHPGRLHNDLSTLIARFLETAGLQAWDVNLNNSAAYLCHELGEPTARFVVTTEALRLANDLVTELELARQRTEFESDLGRMGDTADAMETAELWLRALMARQSLQANDDTVLEAAVYLVTRTRAERQESAQLGRQEVGGLIGQHPRVQNASLLLQLDEFLPRLRHFSTTHVPAWRKYRQLRTVIAVRERKRLRISEFEPRVMTSFVRNQLIQQVYLPIIGDSLAKQIGAAGPSRRTDQMGMLLLISPPGYGKTTLMEYVASRLGLVFMKINGPALGHNVTSLDPAEAPNATARQEVEKVNLSFEMAENVMLYIDDIQHTNSEFLQKFISLCDGQRRIEGVWKGETRTYNLRGRRFCVVMAGNPYTESGDRFQIPDMLANRADTYNLGDILGGKDDLFALSYIENSLTSNPVLSQLAMRDLADVAIFVRMAQGQEVNTNDLRSSWSSVEQLEIVAVLRHLIRVRDVLLKVNRQYIESASQSDNYRREPPFKLQGSYRNMSKLTEKVVSAMNEQEIEQLISDHYRGESQTLTTGAEQNLLKLAEIRGILDANSQNRWQEIRREFVRLRVSGSAGDDPATRVAGAVAALGQQVDGVRHALTQAPSPLQQLGERLSLALASLPELTAALKESALSTARIASSAATSAAAASRNTLPPTPKPAPQAPAIPSPAAVAPTVPDHAATAPPALPDPLLRDTMERMDRLLGSLEQAHVAVVGALRLLAQNQKVAAAATAASAAATASPAVLNNASEHVSNVAADLAAMEKALVPLVSASARHLDQSTAATARLVELMDALKQFLRHLNAKYEQN